MRRGSVGNLDERRKKFQTLAEFIAIDRGTADAVIVGNNPTYFVEFAIRPQEPAYLPHVVPFSTVGTTANRLSPVQGKVNNIVGRDTHQSVTVDNAAFDCCDTALSIFTRSTF